MSDGRKLKVSLVQQIEEIDLCISELKRARVQDNSTWRLRMERLAACRRSLAFIAKKGDEDQLREKPPPVRTI